MRTTWKIYQHGGRHVEAQVFEPERETLDVILFCPGFPGAGATVFEQRHAATLAHEGYAVVVLRHAGTRLDGPHAPGMVNNAYRLMTGRKNGDTHLGGGPSTVDDWLLEPLTALNELAKQYHHIHVIGNSFGALSSMWSLTHPDAVIANVDHLILMAGAQGVHTDSPETDIMRIWKPEYIAVPRITEKVTLNDAEAVAASLKNAYQLLPERMRSFPAAIDLTYLVVMKDEIIHPSDAERFQAAVNGRGRIVRDEIDTGHHQHGLLAHDMPDYPTENLLDLLRK